MEAILFSDVDGTLTLNRTSSLLDLEAVALARKLYNKGITVVLVSGNSLPVLRGLSIYLGLGGYSIAENGAVIYTDGIEVVCRYCDEVNKAKELVLKEGGNKIIDTWQNPFRICDKALKWKGDEEEAINYVKELLRRKGIKDVEVVSSGYAIHLYPSNCNKGSGIKAFLKDYVGKKDFPVYCIGDADNDVSMREACTKLIAVSNADASLKSVADYVTKSPSSKGFIEIAEKLLKNQL